MSYGDGMERLSPCGPEYAAGEIAEFAKMRERILDVGCGRGDTLSLLSRRFGNAKLCGIDADAEMVEMAKKNCPEAELVICRAEKLPYGVSEVDVVLMECVFSLFSEPERCAAEAFRVLRPGGVLLLSDVYGAEDAVCGGNTLGRIYSRAALEETVCAAGFALIRFEDKKEEFLGLAAQMIMDGTFCAHIDAETREILRKTRAGYGAWVFER